MLRMVSGAVVVIVGIAGLIVVQGHRPVHAFTTLRVGAPPIGLGTEERQGPPLENVYHPKTGISRTAYDAVRIGAWALIVVGALLALTGLARYGMAPPRAPT